MTSDVVAAQHDADVLVEERIPAHEHAIADLGPASHPGMVAGASAGSTPGLTSNLVLTKLRRMKHAATTGTRQTADERRDAIIVAALHEFAQGGYSGTSTESIARAVGVSQPYLFQLFGTKRRAVPGRRPARVPADAPGLPRGGPPRSDRRPGLLDPRPDGPGLHAPPRPIATCCASSSRPMPPAATRTSGRSSARSSPRCTSRSKRDSGASKEDDPPLLRRRDAPQRRGRPRDRRAHPRHGRSAASSKPGRAGDAGGAS